MIGIYGGSFNPIHKSHLNILREVLDKNIFSEIWILPTYNGDSSSKKLVDVKHRMKMVNLALIDEKLFNVKCKDIEIANKFTYTYQTMGFLNGQYKGGSFGLIVGSDVNPKTFKNYELIKRTKCLKKIYMIAREGTEVDKEHTTLQIEVGNISSTEIRERIYWKQDLTKYLTKNVIQYIKDNNLY